MHGLDVYTDTHTYQTPIVHCQTPSKHGSITLKQNRTTGSQNSVQKGYTSSLVANKMIVPVEIRGESERH